MDAGTGTGVLATFAARAGAGRVFAVDAAEMIHRAEQVFQRSGVDAVVETLRGDFGSVSLPETLDVIVTETFGALALAEGAVDDLAACAKAHLKENGTVIPHRIDFFVAPVGASRLRDEAFGPFLQVEGVDLSPLVEVATHRAVTVQARTDDLLTAAQCFAQLPFPMGGNHVEGTAHFDLPDEGAVLGLLAWYDLHLAPGVVLSTSPSAPATHWGQCFLPLPEQPTAGQALDLDLEVAPAPDDRRSLEVTAHLRLGERASRGSWRVR